MTHSNPVPKFCMTPLGGGLPVLLLLCNRKITKRITTLTNNKRRAFFHVLSYITNVVSEKSVIEMV